MAHNALLIAIATVIACASFPDTITAAAADPPSTAEHPPIDAAVVDQLYDAWMQQAYGDFQLYLAARKLRVLEWAKQREARVEGGADGSDDDDGESDASSDSNGDGEVSGGAGRVEEKAPPPLDDGDDAVAVPVPGQSPDEAAAHFAEFVSGGRMSREEMMLAHLLEAYNASRRAEAEQLRHRSRLHHAHLHDALRQEGARLAAEGRTGRRAPATRPIGTVWFGSDGGVAFVLDALAVVTLVVIPYRMVLALREQRRTGARRPPPLFFNKED
jgi:hypothetical protein